MTSTLDVDTSPTGEQEPKLVRHDAPGAPSSSSAQGRPRLVQGAFAGLALLVLALSLVVLDRARDHDAAGVARAALRDEVLISARSEIATLNSMDHRDVDGGLEAWRRATTGTLRDQLATPDPADREAIAQRKVRTVGKVVDAAVTELDDATATVIAAVETNVFDETGDPGVPTAPSVRRNRFVAELVKVGDRWLLESLQQVKVGQQ